MSRWELTRHLRDKVKPMVEEYIDWIENQEHEDDILHLSDTGINPVQLHDLLEEIGYIDIDLSASGWEYKYEWLMSHPDKETDAKELCVYGTAMVHDVNLRVY